MAQQPNVEFWFWSSKGIGEYCRWVLNYCQVKYQEVNPEKNQWYSIKFDLEYDFPNLPCLKDGDFRLTENQAIAQYVAEKYCPELAGKTIQDQAYVKMLVGVVNDLYTYVWKPMYNNKVPEIRSGLQLHLKEKADPKLRELERFLGDKEYLMGYPTLADLYLGYLFYNYRVFCMSLNIEDPIFRYAGLARVVNRVHNLPGLKEYLLGQDFRRRPLLPQDFLKFPLIETYANAK